MAGDQMLLLVGESHTQAPPATRTLDGLVTYEARTIKEMLGGMYDLVSFHGTEEDLTPEQRNTIRRLYNEIRPYDKMEQHFKEAEIHASR